MADAPERTPDTARALLRPEWERLLEAEPEVGEREEHLSGPVREGHGWGTKLMKSLERVDTWLTDLNNGDLHRRQKAS